MNIYGKEWFRRRPKCKDCKQFHYPCGCSNMDNQIGLLEKQCIFKDWRRWFDKK